MSSGQGHRLLPGLPVGAAAIAGHDDRSWHAAPPVRIVVAALGFRLVSALLALLVNVTFPLAHHEQLTVFHRTSTFWDTFARFDSGFYQGIAWSGYAPASGRSNIALPGLPDAHPRRCSSSSGITRRSTSRASPSRGSVSCLRCLALLPRASRSLA
jgi:hypothetical protein